MDVPVRIRRMADGCWLLLRPRRNQGRDTPGHRADTRTGVVSKCSTIMTPIHDPTKRLGWTVDAPRAAVPDQLGR